MPVMRVARVCVLGEVALLDVASARAAARRDAAQRQAQHRALAAEAAEQPLDPRRCSPRERWLALSETISTTGASPRASAASKSAGTTTTGSLKRRLAQLRLVVGRRLLDGVGLALEVVAQRRRVRQARRRTTSRCSARASSEATSAEIATSTSGPISTDETSTVSSVRRSRSASISSLRSTTTTGCERRSWRPRRRRVAGERELDEGLLEVASRRCARAARRRVPSATVRPCATTTTLSHSRSTSCMMCVEKTMHLAPPAGVRSQRRLSRRARVASTSRPLVGSSRTMLAGSCTSARSQRRLHALALAEAVGAAVEQRRHLEHPRQVLRRAHRRPRAPCRAGAP